MLRWIRCILNQDCASLEADQRAATNKFYAIDETADGAFEMPEMLLRNQETSSPFKVMGADSDQGTDLLSIQDPPRTGVSSMT
jgi:hypothetical protein